MLKMRNLSVLLIAMLFSIASFGQDCVAPSDLQITFFGVDAGGSFITNLEASSTDAIFYVADYFVDGVFQNSQESSSPPNFSFFTNPENVEYSFTISAICSDGTISEGVTLILDATDPSTDFDCPLPTNVTVESSTVADNSLDIAWNISDGTEGVVIDYYNELNELISSFLSDGTNYTLLLDTSMCVHRVEIYTNCGATQSPTYRFVITTVDDVKGKVPYCCNNFWEIVNKSWIMLCTHSPHEELPDIEKKRNFITYLGAQFYRNRFKTVHFPIVDTSLVCLTLDFTKNVFQDIKEVSLYPNPVEDMLCLNYLVEKTAHISLSIFDISGKKVTDLLVDDLQHIGEQDLKFSLPDLSLGIYFVQLNTGLEQQSFKFIKQ
ncbi:MAG: T9SS type A sorting domain-containing protein [Chitinophagales bacterium]